MSVRSKPEHDGDRRPAGRRRPGRRRVARTVEIDDRHDFTAAFFRCLWDGLEGIGCLALGCNPYSVNGRYRHRQFVDRFYEFPKNLVTMADVAVESAAWSDVYFCPALRTTLSRKAGTRTDAQYAWADVDGRWDDTREATWRQVGVAGSHRISSGYGHHLYCPVGEVVPPPEPGKRDPLELRNKRLVAAFAGDAKWAANALLRVPGTLNHKGRVLADGEPLAVTWGQP